MSWPVPPTNGGAPATPRPKIARPTCSAPLRPKRSPSAPAGQQQPGEHEGVGVDDPLELGLARRRGCPGRASVGRATLVDDRGHDQDQVDAEDAEHEPAAGIGLCRRRVRRVAGRGHGCCTIGTTAANCHPGPPDSWASLAILMILIIY